MITQQKSEINLEFQCQKDKYPGILFMLTDAIFCSCIIKMHREVTLWIRERQKSRKFICLLLSDLRKTTLRECIPVFRCTKTKHLYRMRTTFDRPENSSPVLGKSFCFCVFFFANLLKVFIKYEILKLIIGNISEAF